MRKNGNDSEFMRDGPQVRKPLFAVQNSRQARQLAHVQKHFATTHRSLTEYRSKLSSSIKSGFPEFVVVFWTLLARAYSLVCEESKAQ